jgi:hypothetical protein
LLANDSKNDGYEQSESASRPIGRVVGLGLFSAASALAGGLAVAWWYRKTLNKLQNPIVTTEIPNLEAEEFGDFEQK